MVEAVLWQSRTVHRDYQQRIIESRRVSRVQKCHRNKIKRGFVTRQLPKSRHQIRSGWWGDLNVIGMSGLLFCLIQKSNLTTMMLKELYARPIVVHRKVSGGAWSDWGAQLVAQMFSFLETMRLQGNNAFAKRFFWNISQLCELLSLAGRSPPGKRVLLKIRVYLKTRE